MTYQEFITGLKLASYEQNYLSNLAGTDEESLEEIITKIDKDSYDESNDN